MEETKGMMHLTFDMVISGTLIVICMAAILIGRQLWSVFSSQEAANEKLKDYANYAAYDGTTVSGQDILNLLLSLEDDDPNTFVAVWKGGWTFYLPAAKDPSKAYNLEWVAKQGAGTPVTIAGDLSYISSHYGSPNFGGLTPSAIISGSQYDAQFNGANYTSLVTIFTDPSLLGGYDDGGTPMPGYSNFLSLLVYDADSSTDPIGYVFLRED